MTAHGVVTTTYRHGCRCDACVGLKRARAEAQRIKRRRRENPKIGRAESDATYLGTPMTLTRDEWCRQTGYDPTTRTYKGAE